VFFRIPRATSVYTIRKNGLVFGGRLGDAGKGLGEGIRNFRNAMKKEEPKASEKNSKLSL
jgi:hypothetical protein